MFFPEWKGQLLRATLWMCLLQCFNDLLMFVVFFFYKKRKKNGICTKCLLISKKYIYVATGVSPVKDCKKNKKLTKKRFLLPINVRWCSRSCGQMHCSDTPVCSVCIQHKPTDMRHYLSYSTLPIFQLNHWTLCNWYSS